MPGRGDTGVGARAPCSGVSLCSKAQPRLAQPGEHSRQLPSQSFNSSSTPSLDTRISSDGASCHSLQFLHSLRGNSAILAQTRQ